MRNVLLRTGFILLLPGAVVRGQFALPSLLNASPAEAAYRAVDIDGDTDADLLGLFDLEHFRWHANTDGNGDFSTLLALTTAGEPVGRWATADMNGDALADIVFLSEPGTSVHWLENLGDALFAPPALIGSLPTAPASMQLADITGEGFPEVVFVIDGPGNNIAWYPNQGAGFEPLTFSNILLDGCSASMLLAGDVDMGGGTDLVVSNWNQVVLVLRNITGDALNWEVDTLISGSSFAYELNSQLIDVDNDGDLDLAEAGGIAVHWAENHIGEGGAWSTFFDHELEPWTTAGIGSFVHLGCNAATGVVYVPSNPSLPVQWTAWVDEINDFAHRTELPSIPRGNGLLLADLTGDTNADLVIATVDGAAWYRNVLVPATIPLDLPVLPTLCLYGDPYPLPEVTPAGGQWKSDFNVFQGLLLRSNLPGTGTYTLTHTAYEPAGCPVGGTAGIFVATEPVITPNVSGVICSGNGPVQFTSNPPATTWVGLSPEGILDPATFTGGVFIAVFEDITGTTCAAESGPIEVWNSLPASILPAGPFCITAGPQLIEASAAPPFGATWSGDILSWNSSGATFLPSQGAGTFTVVLNVDPTGPNQCPGTDTLLITVSDAFPQVEVGQLPAQCTTGSPIDLAPLATPSGGVWSGPGLSGTLLDPQALGAGHFILTYTYFDPGGCAASGAMDVALYGSTTVSWEVDDLIFCPGDPAVQFNAEPTGGSWSAPVDANGVLQPDQLAAGTYPLVYTWNGPNGCILVNDASVVERRNSTLPIIDPVGVLCDDDPALPVTGSPAGTWTGAVQGEGSFVLFDPALLGVGTWPLALSAANTGECAGTTTVDIVVELCTGMAESPEPGIRVAPNPFSETITVDLAGSQALSIEVLDAAGRLVLGSYSPSTGPMAILDLRSARPGAYLLRVTLTGGGIRVFRLVKG